MSCEETCGSRVIPNHCADGSDDACHEVRESQSHCANVSVVACRWDDRSDDSYLDAWGSLNHCADLSVDACHCVDGSDDVRRDVWKSPSPRDDVSVGACHCVDRSDDARRDVWESPTRCVDGSVGACHEGGSGSACGCASVATACGADVEEKGSYLCCCGCRWRSDVGGCPESGSVLGGWSGRRCNRSQKRRRRPEREFAHGWGVLPASQRGGEEAR